MLLVLYFLLCVKYLMILYYIFDYVIMNFYKKNYIKLKGKKEKEEYDNDDDLRRKVECEEKRENKRNNLEHDKNIWRCIHKNKGKREK